MRILKVNLHLVNPIIRIQKALHNTKYLPNRRTASDPYQSDFGRYTGLTSECWYRSDIKMAYLTCRCRCKNEISIQHRMVDIVSVKGFRRLDPLPLPISIRTLTMLVPTFAKKIVIFPKLGANSRNQENSWVVEATIAANHSRIVSFGMMALWVIRNVLRTGH